MPLEALELNTIDELYAFVETAIQKTGLILISDAYYRPWARLVSSECHDVRWLYLKNPLPDPLLRHLSNFAHAPLPDKGFVLFEMGRLVKVVDVDAVDGSSRPDRLGVIVKRAFAGKARSATGGQPGTPTPAWNSKNPYDVLGASESDSEDDIKRKYKQAILQYHPDRVAHLGLELRELAAKKTTEINAAFAAIRKMRGF